MEDHGEMEEVTDAGHPTEDHGEMEEVTDDEGSAQVYDASVAAEDPDARRNLEPNAQQYLVDPAARQLSAAELELHPEANRYCLTDDFSLLLSLQETPEIFEMVWRSTGPPDVGNLAVVAERPPERSAFMPATRRHYTPRMRDLLMAEMPMNLRNWNVLVNNFQQITRRLENNVWFFSLFSGLAFGINRFEARCYDPMEKNITKERIKLLNLIPDITALSRLSYDDAEERLRNFMRRLEILETLLRNNILSYASHHLSQPILHGLRYTDGASSQVERHEVRTVSALVARYHALLERSRRPDSQPTTIWSPNSEFSSGYDWGQFDETLQRTLQQASRLREDPRAEMSHFTIARFLGMVREYQAVMDDDVAGLGGIAEQYEHTVLYRFGLLRAERANAFSGTRGDFHVDTRGYTPNLLSTVNRAFDQAARGFPLGRTFIDGRPTFMEWFALQAEADDSSDSSSEEDSGDDNDSGDDSDSGDSNEYPARPSRIASADDSEDSSQNPPAPAVPDTSAPSPTPTLQYEHGSDASQHPSRESTLSYEEEEAYPGANSSPLRPTDPAIDSGEDYSDSGSTGTVTYG